MSRLRRKIKFAYGLIDLRRPVRYHYIITKPKGDIMLTLLLIIIYAAFIGLGLPDSILGSAWPSMYAGLGVGLSSAGIISAIIALGTIVSSLMSERLIRRLGTGTVTLLSVFMTAVALLGFSFSNAFWMLCVWAVPYGLGAGSVDAALNNFVALHYSSRHMSWLHCFWGIGATAGPVVMGWCLSNELGWSSGYRTIGFAQTALVVVLIIAIPLWRKVSAADDGKESGGRPDGKRERLLSIPGAKPVMLAFFCYCSFESTAGLWASSYMVEYRGLGEDIAAKYASMFYLGITAGRFLCGFISEKLGDRRMTRIGQALMLVGAVSLLIPLGTGFMLAGLVLIGLGCAPVFPSLLHATPDHFGRDRSQMLMGVQMASAYTGTTLMPPLFGLLADRLGTQLLPIYLMVLAAVMLVMCERLERVCREKA